MVKARRRERRSSREKGAGTAVVPAPAQGEQDPSDAVAWQLAELSALFAVFPAGHCKGLCQDACVGRVEMKPVEAAYMGPVGQDMLNAGRTSLAIIPAGQDHLRSCVALADDGSCTVYGKRPFRCRLWGNVSWMACSYGCVPPGGFLDDTTACIAFLRWLSLDTDADERAHYAWLIARIPHDPLLRRAIIWSLHVNSNSEYPEHLKLDAARRLAAVIAGIPVRMDDLPEIAPAGQAGDMVQAKMEDHLTRYDKQWRRPTVEKW